ncbi:MAG: hypothetical protein Q8L55_14880 [Phycisphaerales bacterium]|nr:hypothetical protein [Phycisphaerales bacterium]
MNEVPSRPFRRAGMEVALFFIAVLAAGCASTSVAPVVAGSRTDAGKVTFNQRWLESRWLDNANPSTVHRHMPVPNQDVGMGTASPSVAAEQAGLSFDDPASVLSFILLSTPETAVVYPTEQYFYYQFPLGGRLVAGNFRFVETPERLWVGYFNRYDQSEVQARPFDAKDGLTITRRETDLGVVVDLTWRGISRSFILPAAWKQPGIVRMLDGERLISGILDESGVGLGLVYREETGDLFYVLNESAPAPEGFYRHTVGTHEFLIGQESRFIFYRTDERWVLVGVHEEAVRSNSYFDGPFDQIPPELDIRGALERAYPYVKMAGGIDSNGNFLEMAGQRVAISSYVQYPESPLQFCQNAATVMDANPKVGWRALTFEQKRLLGRALGDMNVPSPPQGYQHGVEVSKQWPPAHFPTQSIKQ